MIANNKYNYQTQAFIPALYNHYQGPKYITVLASSFLAKQKCTKNINIKTTIVMGLKIFFILVQQYCSFKGEKKFLALSF